MKFFRFIGCLAITLLFSTLSSLSADSSVQESIQSSSLCQAGQFENGMVYAIIPSANQERGIWVKLNCLIPYDQKQSSLAQLVQHALFYGTHHKSHQAILDNLHALKLNVEPKHYIKFNELEQGFHFSLPNQDTQSVQTLFNLMHEIVFSASLTDESIELARQHFESTESPTASEVRAFYAQWYQPQNMQLSLMGAADPQKTLELLVTAFGPIRQDSVKTIQEDYAFTKSVDFNYGTQSYVVDNKIWMNPPNWINRYSVGKTLGGVLTFLGIVGMIAAAAVSLTPVGVPALLIAGGITGGLTSVTGIYFLSSSYLKDPYYVENVRKEDLQYGCSHAYKNSRAGITLTPFERRSLFIQEMVYSPHLLSSLPILVLADLYQLHEPVLAELFTNEEFKALNQLKLEFVLQRNEYKKLKSLLDNELVTLATPYAILRDSALSQVRDIYNQNYFVVAERNMQFELDEVIRAIEKAFEREEISLDEHDDLIKQARENYEFKHSSPEFQAGLYLAKVNRDQREKEIEALYFHQVELCKQSIRYYERMASLEYGENSLTHYYNEELYQLLSEFPLQLPSLPDYLDLRTQS